MEKKIEKKLGRVSPPGTPQTRPESRYPPDQTPPPRSDIPPPVNRITEACKNITLPQTSSAGDKNHPTLITNA